MTNKIEIIDPNATPETTGRDLITQSIGFLGLPSFIISTFFPDILRLANKYPRLVRTLSLPLVLYLIVSYASGKFYALWRYLMSNCMSSVTISASDVNLSAAFRRFLEDKRLLLSERDKAAHSATYIRNQAVNTGVAYNKDIVKPGSVNYESLNDLQAFRHRNRFYFITSRAIVSRYLEGQVSGDFKIWTFGWSPLPIERLINDAYNAEQFKQKQVKTSVYYPDRGSAWALRCTRGRRPLSSVYLDKDIKKDVVRDLADYLAPATARWYSQRGIPLRRGFLFHGKPGCGKTSLALAIAGHFKLDLYLLSLLDPDVTDRSLLTLFQSLRPGVIILLEDVDSAGIGRETEGSVESYYGPNGVPDATSSGDDYQYIPWAQMTARQKKIHQRRLAREGLLPPAKVTLSGLLNAIDGAGAPEGHVLIMTSNKPESLDEALVRAGRVDVRVHFEYSSKEQTYALFVNMYRPPKTLNDEGEKTEEYKQKLAEIKRLGRQFADKVPSKKLSPAQLQDYILTKKNRPEEAIANVEKWMRKEISLDEEVFTNGVEHDEDEEPAGVTKGRKATDGNNGIEEIENDETTTPDSDSDFDADDDSGDDTSPAPLYAPPPTHRRGHGRYQQFGSQANYGWGNEWD